MEQASQGTGDEQARDRDATDQKIARLKFLLAQRMDQAHFLKQVCDHWKKELARAERMVKETTDEINALEQGQMDLGI